MNIFYTALLFFAAVPIYPETRTNGLPKGFIWQYIIDEKEPSPRSGQFWRSGIFIGDKIFVLNRHYLIALERDTGKMLWIRGLPSENPISEAKILHTDTNEIIVIISDALLRISTKDGELLQQYSYDARKHSAFQHTLLMPRHSIFFNNKIYVFLGPDLLEFDKHSLKRNKLFTFNASPKTLPLTFGNELLLGFQNGFLELFSPSSKKRRMLICGSPYSGFSLRQPVIQDLFIFVPTSDELLVYREDEIFARNSTYKDGIFSSAGGRVWLREHFSGILTEMDETLSPLRSMRIEAPSRARAINTPVIGNSRRIMLADTADGDFKIMNIQDLSIISSITSEDFLDHPPLQILDMQENHILLGAFDGLYLIDLNLF